MVKHFVENDEGSLVTKVWTTKNTYFYELKGSKRVDQMWLNTALDLEPAVQWFAPLGKREVRVPLAEVDKEKLLNEFKSVFTGFRKDLLFLSLINI